MTEKLKSREKKGTVTRRDILKGTTAAGILTLLGANVLTTDKANAGDRKNDWSTAEQKAQETIKAAETEIEEAKAKHEKTQQEIDEEIQKEAEDLLAEAGVKLN